MCKKPVSRFFNWEFRHLLIDAAEISFERYDVVVAGSGLAAYALARRLSEAGKSTLILETGQADFDDTVQTRFSKMFGRGHYKGSYWPVHWVRALGGTSAVWAGVCGPLSERNLRNWPLTRDQLDPYYRMAADYLRRTETFLSFSADFLPGFTYRPMSNEDSLRLGQEPELLLKLPSIDVALGVTLSELHANADRSAVEAISIHRLDDTARRVELQQGQTVVLAGGAMGNAQILLSSRSGGVAVGNESDQVGKYLMEHPHMIGCARIVAPAGFTIPARPDDFGEQIDVIAPDDKIFDQIGGLDVSLELVESPVNRENPVEAYLSEKIGAGAKAFDINARAEMPPEPGNRVKLAEGADPSGLRRLRAICYISTDTFRAVDTCLEILGDRLMQSGPARLRIASSGLVSGVSGGGHIMGTTRMGTSPRTSVVDADCRVHGYRNLYVAGSSVFSTGGYVNPTLSIMALAARLGDKLASGR